MSKPGSTLITDFYFHLVAICVSGEAGHVLYVTVMMMQHRTVRGLLLILDINFGPNFLIGASLEYLTVLI